mmetsp:Transcript_64665/g.169316  ORF Transcript_64665/g.169316 Transcript_64665/m.169316 type:complete len:356 (+) Transcript_64665:297-1364(+)
MRSFLIEDGRHPDILHSLDLVGAVEHALEAVVHPVAAAPGRLVDVRQDARQVRRDAASEGAARGQRDGLPVAGQLRLHQAPEPRHEVLRGRDVVLEDHGQGSSARHAGPLGPEVPCGTADRPGDASEAAHVVLRLVGLRLRPLDAVAAGDEALVDGVLLRTRLAHVHAPHEAERDVELVEPLGDGVYPRFALRKAQHIDGHVVSEPRHGLRPIAELEIHRLAQLAPVAQLGVLQRAEGGGDRGGGVDGLLALLFPREALPQVLVATLLHADPAPVPAEAALLGQLGLREGDHLPAIVAHLLRDLPELGLRVGDLGPGVARLAAAAVDGHRLRQRLRRGWRRRGRGQRRARGRGGV